jgi:hypothetical protein
VLELPGLPEKGDIVDWAARGGTPDRLRELIETDARLWQPSDPNTILQAARNITL